MVGGEGEWVVWGECGVYGLAADPAGGVWVGLEEFGAVFSVGCVCGAVVAFHCFGYE